MHRPRYAVNRPQGGVIIPTTTKADSKESTTMTAPEAAKAIGTDAKSFRRYLRASGKAVGQGSRYELPQSELRSLKSGFQKWEKDQEAKRAAREADKAKAATEAEKPADEAKS